MAIQSANLDQIASASLVASFVRLKVMWPEESQFLQYNQNWTDAIVRLWFNPATETWRPICASYLQFVMSRYHVKEHVAVPYRVCVAHWLSRGIKLDIAITSACHLLLNCKISSDSIEVSLSCHTFFSDSHSGWISLLVASQIVARYGIFEKKQVQATDDEPGPAKRLKIDGDGISSREFVQALTAIRAENRNVLALQIITLALRQTGVTPVDVSSVITHILGKITSGSLRVQEWSWLAMSSIVVATDIEFVDVDLITLCVAVLNCKNSVSLCAEVFAKSVFEKCVLLENLEPIWFKILVDAVSQSFVLSLVPVMLSSKILSESVNVTCQTLFSEADHDLGRMWSNFCGDSYWLPSSYRLIALGLSSSEMGEFMSQFACPEEPLLITELSEYSAVDRYFGIVHNVVLESDFEYSKHSKRITVKEPSHAELRKLQALVASLLKAKVPIFNDFRSLLTYTGTLFWLVCIAHRLKVEFKDLYNVKILLTQISARIGDSGEDMLLTIRWLFSFTDSIVTHILLEEPKSQQYLPVSKQLLELAEFRTLILTLTETLGLWARETMEASQASSSHDFLNYYLPIFFDQLTQSAMATNNYASMICAIMVTYNAQVPDVDVSSAIEKCIFMNANWPEAATIVLRVLDSGPVNWQLLADCKDEIYLIVGNDDLKFNERNQIFVVSCIQKMFLHLVRTKDEIKDDELEMVDTVTQTIIEMIRGLLDQSLIEGSSFVRRYISRLCVDLLPFMAFTPAVQGKFIEYLVHGSRLVPTIAVHSVRSIINLFGLFAAELSTNTLFGDLSLILDKNKSDAVKALYLCRLGSEFFSQLSARCTSELIALKSNSVVTKGVSVIAQSIGITQSRLLVKFADGLLHSHFESHQHLHTFPWDSFGVSLSTACATVLVRDWVVAYMCVEEKFEEIDQLAQSVNLSWQVCQSRSFAKVCVLQLAEMDVDDLPTIPHKLSELGNVFIHLLS